MWFDSWSDITRLLLTGAGAYVALLAILRISGKRTLAKLNAFDLVVTVALGSTLSSTFLDSTVSWTEGVLAIAALVALQYVVARISSTFPRSRGVLTSGPTAVLRDGAVLPGALASQRLTTAEVLQAVRSSGQGDLSGVAAVVLEPDGTLSVIPASAMGGGSALDDVDG